MAAGGGRGPGRRCAAVGGAAGRQAAFLTNSRCSGAYGRSALDRGRVRPDTDRQSPRLVLGIGSRRAARPANPAATGHKHRSGASLSFDRAGPRLTAARGASFPFATSRHAALLTNSRCSDAYGDSAARSWARRRSIAHSTPWFRAEWRTASRYQAPQPDARPAISIALARVCQLDRDAAAGRSGRAGPRRRRAAAGATGRGAGLPRQQAPPIGRRDRPAGATRQQPRPAGRRRL